jgi:hypothetical protein
MPPTLSQMKEIESCRERVLALVKSRSENYSHLSQDESGWRFISDPCTKFVVVWMPHARQSIEHSLFHGDAFLYSLGSDFASPEYICSLWRVAECVARDLMYASNMAYHSGWKAGFQHLNSN